jgi:putative oxidoreductase
MYPYARWAPLVLRLITGIGLMAHGLAKLARGSQAFAAVLEGMHVPLAGAAAWLTILVELGGGLAVIAGAYIPLVSVPVAVVLVVAVVKVHWPFGFSSIKLVSFTALGPVFGPPGYELDLFYLACLATLTMGGPGPFALDRLITNLSIPRDPLVQQRNRQET